MTAGQRINTWQTDSHHVSVTKKVVDEKLEDFSVMAALTAQISVCEYMPETHTHSQVLQQRGVSNKTSQQANISLIRVITIDS